MNDIQEIKSEKKLRIQSNMLRTEILDYMNSVGSLNNNLLVNNKKKIHLIYRKLMKMRVRNHVFLPRYSSNHRVDALELASVNINNGDRLNVRLNIAKFAEEKDVVMLQETRCNVEVNGYISYYNPDHTGTAVLVKNRYNNHRRIEEQFAFGTIVELLLNTREGIKKLAIGSIYIPHSCKKEALNATMKLYKDLSKSYYGVFLGGDYNTYFPKMKELCMSNDIQMNSMGKPTRVSGHCIDYILSNRIRSKYGQDSSWWVSDHLPVCLSVKMKKVGVAVRSSNVINFDDLIKNNEKLDVAQENAGDLDSVTNICQDYTKEFVSPRKRSLKALSWFNHKTKHSLKRLKSLNTNLFSVLSIDDEDVEDEVRKKDVGELRKERDNERKFFKKCVIDDMLKAEKRTNERLAKANNRDMWKFAKNSVSRKSDGNITLVVDNGLEKVHLTSPKEVADRFLSGFASVFDKGERVERFVMNYQFDKCHKDEILLNKPFSIDEIKSAIRRLATRKALGLDGIPGEVFKASKVIPTVLVSVFNKIWLSGRYPESWNDSYIVPIFKKGSKTDSANYRPITVMNALAKLYAILLTDRLTEIVYKYNIIKEEQAGFMKGKNCVQQAVVLHELCSRRRRIGKNTKLLFVDFAKAYDSVNHSIQFTKLSHYGITGNLLNNIMSMYRDPRVCVRVNDTNSSFISVKCGLKQGDPSSPILFNQYINDLLDIFSGVDVPAMGVGSTYTQCDCSAPSTDRYCFGVYVDQSCRPVPPGHRPKPYPVAIKSPSLVYDPGYYEDNMSGGVTKKYRDEDEELFEVLLKQSEEKAALEQSNASKRPKVSDSTSEVVDVLNNVSDNTVICVNRNCLTNLSPLKDPTGKVLRVGDSCECGYAQMKQREDTPVKLVSSSSASVCSHSFKSMKRSFSSSSKSKYYTNMSKIHIRGLLYADDLVIASDSMANIQGDVDRLRIWCVENRMSVNISKCGFMKIKGRIDTTDKGKELSFDKDNVFPVIESYKYLGILFQSNLSYREVIEDRCLKAMNAIKMYSKLLSKRSCSFFVKNHILRGVVLPALLYGVEYWCVASPGLLDKIRVTFNNCVRIAYNFSSSSSADLICYQVNIKPLEVYMNKRIIKTYSNFRRCKGFQGQLSVIDPRGNPSGETYFDKLNKYLSNFYNSHVMKGIDNGWNVDRNNIFHINHFNVVIEMFSRLKFPKSFIDLGGFQLPNRLDLFSSEYYLHFKSMPSLLRILMGKFPGCQNLAKWGIISDSYLRMCPMCNENEGESLEHYLFSCSKFSSDRLRCFPSGVESQVQITDNCLYDLASVLGCGSQNDFTNRFLKLRSSHEVLKTKRLLSHQVLAKLCQFIESTYSTRFSIISTLKQTWAESKVSPGSPTLRRSDDADIVFANLPGD